MMEIAMDSSIMGCPVFVAGPKSPPFLNCNRILKIPCVNSRTYLGRPPLISSKVGNFRPYLNPGVAITSVSGARTHSKSLGKVSSDLGLKQNGVLEVNLERIIMLVRRAVILSSVMMVFACKKAFAAEGVVNAGYGVIGQSILLLRNAWPKALQLLKVFKEQGLVLAILLGLSAFFSMAETSITTLWPWKVRELAEKESGDGVFKMLRSDVTRFLTTILIGTTVVNIGATALVTEAATAIFGEAGVSAATGVMTVRISLLPFLLHPFVCACI
uniref:CBS domain-containing family protein n=1 Tax=Rhizophora mucronata TaxID=61149 RepID=A0A2P2KSM6_RHIMU